MSRRGYYNQQQGGGGPTSYYIGGTQFYIKEAYIFNRALSLTEIRQIHGYEPLPF